jgi:hypothetical protein
MMTFIGKIFAEYNINDAYDIRSTAELTLRQQIISNPNYIISKIFNKDNNNDLSPEEKAYFIYTVISGLEMCVNTVEVNWLEYRNKVDNKIYCDYIALTNGQSKLLINTLLHDNNIIDQTKLSEVFNCYQLAYINTILTNEKWTLNEHQKYYYPDWTTKYQGERQTDMNEIMYNFFENPECCYTLQNMYDYIILTFRKLYSYKRLNISTQSTNIKQLIQLLGVLTTQDNITSKFRKFLQALDEEQIIMIGF